MPFSVTIPSAIATSTCGVCNSKGSLRKYIECKSLDTGFAPLWICTDCNAIYNATAENDAMDVVEWQKRWAQDEQFYAVPSGDEFERIVSESEKVFEFFSNDLGVTFSGNYVEIGAGSGLMAAAASRFFDKVYVFDHVQSRLEKVKEKIGDHYIVCTAEDLNDIKADAILIWHAMEHFLAPGSVFKFCASMLNSGGLFLAQVPVLSVEHVYPGHYYFYCERAFETIASQNRMEVLHFYFDHNMNAMTVAMRKRAD